MPGIYRASAWAIVALVLGGLIPAFAQEKTAPATEQWRPKNGIYGFSGKGFAKQCKEEGGNVVVELVEKTILGYEWGCKITKLTDTGPAAIRLNLICSDVNLAGQLPSSNPEPEFKEIITFRRIDDKSLYMNKTQNGKYPGPEYRIAYCPEAAQRDYMESKGK